MELSEDTPEAPWGTVETHFDEIHCSARLRNLESIKAELAMGVDVDIPNGKATNGDGGNTALWFAAQGPSNGIGAVRVLVESGAEVDRVCEHGRTALHIAAWWGHVEVVKYLMEHGADPLKQTDEEGTAPDITRAQNRSELIQYFKSIGI